MKISTIIITVLLLSGCSSRTLVLDKGGIPVKDAWLRIDYPSFNGPTFHADSNGSIKYDISSTFEPVQATVESSTSGSIMLTLPIPEKVILDGTKWQDKFQLIKTPNKDGDRKSVP